MFQGPIIFSVFNVRQFIEVKTSTSVSPISSDSLILLLLLFCLKVISFIELSCQGREIWLSDSWNLFR